MVEYVFDWEHEKWPGWDKTGTIAESWYAVVNGCSCRIDRFTDEEGGGYAYTVTPYSEEIDYSPIPGGDGEPADSFEAAEEAIRRLLATRLA